MFYYTSEKNVQMVIALMKEHGIRRIITSPGTTNVTFVGSVQNDPYFELYSVMDERSAAYMACGLAAETGEPVALSCTGATASRNYFPALTEAYYRHLPVLAITSTQYTGRVGHNIAQVIDRSVQPRDTVKLSVDIPAIYNEEEEWNCNVKINAAITELTRNGGGPVHINLATTYSRDFSVKELPKVRVIKRYQPGEAFPKITGEKTAVYVGNHVKWNKELTEAVDLFCEKYNGIVLCDHTSNYKGKYAVQIGLVPESVFMNNELTKIRLLIHLGDVSATSLHIKADKIWRVAPDGNIIDTFKKLSAVFQVDELCFFKHYAAKGQNRESDTSFYEYYKKVISSEQKEREKIELPFSSLWLADKTLKQLPENCVLHLAILTSLETWNKYAVNKSIPVYSNTGGFGIDGVLSSVVGASFANPEKLYFCVIGDLAFFYDMNCLGNKHIKNNLRIMLVNNGKGHTMRKSALAGIFEDEADMYIAAEGHNGRKSKCLVKHIAEDLGFKYITASTKQEYLENLNTFIDPDIGEKSVIFEVFTDSRLENEAQAMMRKNSNSTLMNMAESAVRKVAGEAGYQKIKKFIKKRGGFS